ncbi:MAG: MFS transporter [Actinomycetales bacterium]|nr:MFS transporter [Actinomycetales bacterium]
MPHPTPTSPVAPAKKRLWTRDLVLAFVANFALALVFYALMTTMALYAVERFGASDGSAGLAASIFVIGAVAARLFAGNLVDLVGRRKALAVSFAVFLVASLAYVPVDSGAASLGALLAVRAVHGVAFGVASTAAMALGQSLIPASRRAEGTGYFTLSATLATAVGPFLALLLMHGPGYQALFLASGVVAVGGMVVSLFLRTTDAPLTLEDRARLRRFHPRDMLHTAVLPVASFMLVLAVAFSGVLTFVNSFATERGLERGATLFFVVYAVVLFASRLVAGRIQDARGPDGVVYVAVAAFAGGLVLLALAASDLTLVVAGGLIGAGFGTLMSAIQAIAVERVPRHRVGVAISTHFFMVDLGVGLGPVVLGAVLAVVDFGVLYLVLAVIVALSTGLYFLVHARPERRREVEAAREPALAEAF